ncbi:MAG TPA: hypothetical protein VFE62_28620 [Gemmataceae bacterium]|nr:hypothetical protein [Gemmataceae bacterium]
MLIRTTSLLLLFTSLAGAVCAGDCWDEKDPVKVTLVVILASEEGNHVDKRLKAVATEIQKLHPHLKSFSIKSQEQRSLKPNEKVSLMCAEKRKVDMVINHGADKDNRVSLKIKPPQMSELEYQSVCGKFLPIVTPCKTAKGETIILAIRVEPCRAP